VQFFQCPPACTRLARPRMPESASRPSGRGSACPGCAWVFVRLVISFNRFVRLSERDPAPGRRPRAFSAPSVFASGRIGQRGARNAFLEENWAPFPGAAAVARERCPTTTPSTWS
jgi:hypothetical protein